MQEDAELREYIAEYPEAKEQFQEALDIHVALKSDADATVLPADLALATEESVLMQILGDLPPAEEKKKRRVVPLWWSLPTAAVLTGILGFVFSGSLFDNEVQKNVAFLDNYQAVELEMPFPSDDAEYLIGNDASSNIENAIAYSDVQDISPERSNHYEPANASANSMAESNTNNNSFAVRGSRMIQADGDMEHAMSAVALADEGNETVDTDFSGSGSYVSRADYDERISENSAPLWQESQNLYASLPISLTTTIGTEVASNGANNGAVFSFASQSLAYGISDAGKIGLEAGHFSYAFNTVERVYVPKVKAFGDNVTIPPTPLKGGSGQINVLDQSSEELSAHGQFLTLVSTKEKSSVFGSVFYEHRLYNSEHFHFLARIGFGGSSDGLLTYVRTGTGYELSSTVSLNAGIDMRYLQLRSLQNNAPQTNHIGISLFSSLNITL